MLIDESITGNLDIREFDEIQKSILGKYIYALKDPRDGKIFYIGQGEGNRVFNHFLEADNCLRENKRASSKVLRILDIWKNEEDVEWFIIAYNVASEADRIEAAAIDVLTQSQNGMPVNENKGPKSTVLTKEEVIGIGAKCINPSTPYRRVFIFPIHNALSNGDNEYEATRKYWKIKKSNQEIPAFAVGLKAGVSKGSFRISRWHDDAGKCFFDGEAHIDLMNYKWNCIINKARGYWQRGNYLIVEFDGHGRFKMHRGSSDNKEWYNIDNS